jgi:hypothetical protein
MVRPEMTVGFAVHNDFNGVFFSVMALRVYHQEAMRRCEIVVVDNDPDGEEGQAVRDFLGWVRTDCAMIPEEVQQWAAWLDLKLSWDQACDFVEAVKGGLLPQEEVRRIVPAYAAHWGLKAHPCLYDELALWATRRLVNVQYVPYKEETGTAAPRAKVFEVAQGQAVLVMDAHVFLWPGAVGKLLNYWHDHPASKDVVSGPVMMDDLRQYATHFEDVWRDEMWGVWGVAWECECGHVYETREQPRDTPFTPWCLLVSLETNKLEERCPKCGKALPRLDWHGHEPRLAQAGFRRVCLDEARLAELTIPAHGLGVFSMLKSQWPGFNQKFRGFGGEEFYLHTKVRQRGGKALSLPFLKWIHRFYRPGGIKYPLNLWSKVRNYVIGHKELGIPLDRVHAHFVAPHTVIEDGKPVAKPGRVNAHEWQQLLEGKDWPAEEPKSDCTPCDKAGSLEERLNMAIINPSDLNEHVPALKDLAGQCRHVTALGGRHGVSTVALLAGQPERLFVVDAGVPPEADALRRMAGKTSLHFKAGNSLGTDIEDTDFLFIDTTHTADHLYQELRRHAPKVRRWIALHDTVIYGENGEGGGPGLLPAVRRYLRENPEWTVKKHYRHQYGLLILTRDQGEKKKLPPDWKRAFRYVKAGIKHGLDGFGTLEGEAYERRLSLCVLCDSRNGDHCGECGCPIEKKASWPTEACPLGNWHQEESHAPAR